MSEIAIGTELEAHRPDPPPWLQLAIGDLVELTSVPAGREKRLRVGLVGTVVVAPEGQEFGWVSCTFTGAGSYPYLLAPRHLRLAARAAEVDGC